MPTTAVGSKPQAVSSSVSRTTASRKVSPSSRCPAGWLITTRPLARSSTNRNLPSRCAMAATVTSGFQTMSGIIRSRPGPTASEIDGSRPQLGLDQAHRPDLVEVSEVAPDHLLVVVLDDAVPAGALLAVHDGGAVGDDERGRVVAELRR